jgi:glycosyltransferase involved in cell wall biosynthesis
VRTRVAFVSHVGRRGGGAELTLALVLERAPPEIQCVAIVFEDGEFADTLRALGLRVIVVPFSSALVNSKREAFLRPILEVPLGALRLAKVLRDENVELVYTNSMKAHFIAGAAARLIRRPCVFSFHDFHRGLALRSLRWAAWLFSRERIACSAALADDMAVGRTAVIYPALDIGAYRDLPSREAALAKLGLPADLPVVALVGRINRWKGHDRFVRIAARVNARVPARFVIVGAPVFRDADFVPELEALARENGLGERLRFITWLDDVRDVYAAAAVNTNCSTREPFGRTIAEAAAAGVPSVCFDDSGAAEMIADGVSGRTVAAGDEAAFADAIVAYLESPELLAAAGRAARSAVEVCDARTAAERTAAVIERAMTPIRRHATSR